MENKKSGEFTTALGIFLSMLVFVSGFVLAGNIGLYFNFVGLIIVVGGTLTAALVGYSMKRLIILYRILKGAYQVPLKRPHEIVEILIDLSVKSKLKGLLSLQEDEEETTLLFPRL